MSKNLESKYAKKQSFDGVDYTIFDVKQAAIGCDFEMEKLPYSLRVLFENVVRNSSDKESLLTFKRWLKNNQIEQLNMDLKRV